MQLQTPPPSFWARNGKSGGEKSEYQQRLCFFGSKVWNTHQDAKMFVNNQCNSHWKSVILDKSGNSPSSVFLGIRQHLWTIEMGAKAERAVKERLRYCAKLKQDGKTAKTHVELSNTVSMQDLLKPETDKLLEKGFPNNYYPLQWMIFVLFGKPGGDRSLQSYSSGRGSSDEASKPSQKKSNESTFKTSKPTYIKRGFTLSEIAEEVKNGKGSKQSRRATRDSSNEKEKPTLPHTVRLEISRGEGTIRDERMKNLRERISILKELISEGIKVVENKLKLINCYEQLETLLADRTADLTQSQYVSNVTSAESLQFNSPSLNYTESI
jgi:hypothetical protein